MVDIGLDLLDESAFGVFLGPQDGIFDSGGIRAAVGLDDGPGDPEERRAADLARGLPFA